MIAIPDPSRAGAIPDPLAWYAARTPRAACLAGPGWTWTFSEVEARVAGVAGALASEGMGEGMRVGVRMPNNAEHVVLLLALWRIGAAACEVNLRRPADGERARLAALGVERVLETLPDYTTLPDYATLAPREAPPWRLDREATAVFTSGSTGGPKAALHTMANHVYNASGANENMPLGGSDRWLLSLPLYHVGGLAIVVRCLLAGASVWLPAAGTPIGEALAASSATHASLVATQLVRLLDAPAVRLGGMKGLLLGGGPMPAGLVDEALARGLPVCTTYGMTEMASQVTTTAPGGAEADLRSSGRLLPHRRIRIADDGEILVAGPTLFVGYLREGGAVDPARDADGWFHTRDRGRIDAGGRLHVEGRVDNMFVSGGENVQPEEIEAALADLPGVARAIVVPVPDPEFGHRPVAFVDGALPAARLESALRARLPGYAVPRAFLPWPGELDAGMKPDRAAFARLARERQ